MTYRTFDKKWETIREAPAQQKAQEEVDIFVPPGEEPQTQRQLNLYYYFLFIKDILEKQGARKVLEIGCGRGTLSLYLVSYLGLNVSLLDDSEGAIAVARSLFEGHDQVAQFYVENALKTSFLDSQFDAVVSIGLAEHLDNVAALFAEQYRLLKPGGVMVSLNIPKKFSIQFLNTLMRAVKKLLGQYRESVTKDYYRNTLSPEEYAAAAASVGFRQITITPMTPFPLYTPVSLRWDRWITAVNKVILKIRSLFMAYPYKTNRLVTQAHFLVGYKQ